MQLSAQFVRVAHDPGDPQITSHCPFCGSGQVSGRSDGTIDCSFCGMNYIVRVQPAFPGMPQQPMGPGALTDVGPEMGPGSGMDMGMPGMPTGPGMEEQAEMEGEGGPPFGGEEGGEDGGPEEPPGGPESDEDEEAGPPPPKGKGSGKDKKAALTAAQQLQVQRSRQRSSYGDEGQYGMQGGSGTCSCRGCPGHPRSCHTSVLVPGAKCYSCRNQDRAAADSTQVEAARYRTLAGDELDEETYVRHLAVLHSAGSPRVLAQLRREAWTFSPEHERVPFIRRHMSEAHGWPEDDIMAADRVGRLEEAHDHEHAEGDPHRKVAMRPFDVRKHLTTHHDVGDWRMDRMSPGELADWHSEKHRFTPGGTHYHGPAWEVIHASQDDDDGERAWETEGGRYHDFTARKVAHSPDAEVIAMQREAGLTPWPAPEDAARHLRDFHKWDIPLASVRPEQYSGYAHMHDNAHQHGDIDGLMTPHNHGELEGPGYPQEMHTYTPAPTRSGFAYHLSARQHDWTYPVPGTGQWTEGSGGIDQRAHARRCSACGLEGRRYPGPQGGLEWRYSRSTDYQGQPEREHPELAECRGKP